MITRSDIDNAIVEVYSFTRHLEKNPDISLMVTIGDNIEKEITNKTYDMDKAIAGAWSDPKHSSKVMDSDYASDLTQYMRKLIDAKEIQNSSEKKESV
jgi:hypothetical protein